MQYSGPNLQQKILRVYLTFKISLAPFVSAKYGNPNPKVPSHLIYMTLRSHTHFPHFIVEETKAQRG